MTLNLAVCEIMDTPLRWRRDLICSLNENQVQLLHFKEKEAKICVTPHNQLMVDTRSKDRAFVPPPAYCSLLLASSPVPAGIDLFYLFIFVKILFCFSIWAISK